MKKTIISALSAVIVIAFATIIAILMNLSKPADATANSVEVSETTISESVEEYVYMMKRYNNIIGIYKPGEGMPFKTINVLVDTLPQYDIDALDNGIAITTDEELQKLIEDFES